MKRNLVENPNEVYSLVEEKARKYFKLLEKELKNKTYLDYLKKDFKDFGIKHIEKPSIHSYITKKVMNPSKSDYNFVKWLEHKNILEEYLNRSVYYIFMRDLGEDLELESSKSKIEKITRRLRNYLINLDRSRGSGETFLDKVVLYKNAEENKIEASIIWLMNKLALVYENIPDGMDRDNSQRKIIKVVAGVILNEFVEMDEDISLEERARRLDISVRLGYSYGLTYPFIDDILDSKILSKSEEEKYTNLIYESIVTGTVSDFNDWTGENKELIEYIQKELNEAFNYIKNNQNHQTIKSFFEKCYIFFNSQEKDRNRDINNKSYTNEEIYNSIILKAYSSRVITKLIVKSSSSEYFDDQMFFYGIYNQLADDFTDIFEDMEKNSLTPYTYYMKNHKENKNLINPFELYFVVVFNLVHNTYKSNDSVKEVILCRVINGLKRFKKRLGEKEYNNILTVFKLENKELMELINDLVDRAENVEFFDKMLRDNIILNFKKDGLERDEFKETVENLRKDINDNLQVKEKTIENDRIVEASNYSLKGEGKRLRPIITWFIGINEYNLEKNSLIPLVKSLEYMHTASLIFDDLPSQDNADSRRGLETIHKVYNEATAELTALYLTQKAVELQTDLNFKPERIIELINYSVKIIQDICKGQLMDIDSRGKLLSPQELNTLCFYKTGKAFEASIVMPAILANKDEREIEVLKKFSYHSGIAFQIKDDLLDIEGEEDLTGKDIGKDRINKSSTFVSILGVEKAKKELWTHYIKALEILEEISYKTNFLKHILDYIINRNK